MLLFWFSCQGPITNANWETDSKALKLFSLFVPPFFSTQHMHSHYIRYTYTLLSLCRNNNAHFLFTPSVKHSSNNLFVIVAVAHNEVQPRSIILAVFIHEWEKLKAPPFPCYHLRNIDNWWPINMQHDTFKSCNLFQLWHLEAVNWTDCSHFSLPLPITLMIIWVIIFISFVLWGRR